MSSYNYYNPFARRESYGAYPLATYRVLTPLSWALVVVIGIFYSIRSPDDVSNGHTIWKQFHHHITAFSANTVVTGIYWILLLLAQLTYLFQLFSKEDTIVTRAANIASRFILNNLFIFAWILLWTRNHFWGSEVILVVHFIHQQITFWRNSRTLPPLAHLSVVAAPYAWTLIALFWNGAVAVHSSTSASVVAANVFIWVVFLLGEIHILLAADDLLGYSLSFLTLGLAVQQYDDKIIPRQWIFAWVIFAVFFAESLYVSAMKYTNRPVWFWRAAEPESTDAERAPLLHESNPPASSE